MRATALVALLIAAVEVIPAQGQGTAGAAAGAAADVQPPSLTGQVAMEQLPEVLAEPAPVRPTLAPQPVASVPAKLPGAHKVDSKYDVDKIGDRSVGKGLDFYSLEREQMLGKELSLEVEGSSRLMTDPVVTEFVNRIGQNLVRNSDAKVPFTIKVIDDSEVNAFALPGGYFYVNSGLIMAADNEAELAGVMAHEIAHVAARHATKNATRMQLINLASIPMIFVGGPIGYAVRQVAGLAVPMSFLKFSRDAEREADLLGLEYEYACGYDPQEFVRFFEKLKLQEKGKYSFIARAFNTHPMTADRIKAAQAEITKYLPAKNQYVVDTSEFEAVKARLANLENMRMVDAGDSAKPTLRRRSREGSGDGDKTRDGRPTLKRMPQ